MQAWKFEQQVFAKEQIRIVIRVPSETSVKKFNYDRAAKGNTTVNDWLQTRIYPLTGDHEVMVVNGRGETYPHGSTHMSTLRATYENE
jgi:hypothetical protein